MMSKSKISLDTLDDDDRWLISSLIKENKSISYIAKKLRHEEEMIQDFLDSIKASSSLSDSTNKLEITETTFTRSPKPEEIGTFVEEAKFGKAKAIPIEIMDQQQAAVCQIQFKNDRPFASGFFMDVLDNIGILTTNQILPNNTECEGSQAVFVDAETLERIPVKFDHQKMFFTDEKLDATFVACNEEDLKTLTKFDIEPWKEFGKVTADSSVTIYYTSTAKGQKVSAQRKASICKEKTIGYDGTIGNEAIGAPVYCQEKLVGLHHGAARTMGDTDSVTTKNEAIRIHVLIDWIKQNFSKPNNYKQGLLVQACWDDNNWYPAKIIEKTDLGYLINYEGFDQKQNLPIDRIKKFPYSETGFVMVPNVTEEYDIANMSVEEWLSSLELTTKYWPEFEKLGYTDMTKILAFNPSQIDKMLHEISSKHGTAMKIRVSLNQCMQKISSITSTTTTTTTTSSTSRDSEYELEDMDKELIDGLVLRGTSLEQIASKIGQPQDQVKAYIEETLPDLSAVKNEPMPLDWKPTSNDIDYTSVFTRNGKCSIRFASDNIYQTQGRTPAGTKVLPKEFYLRSTAKQMWFKMSLKYSQFN